MEIASIRCVSAIARKTCVEVSRSSAKRLSALLKNLLIFR